MSFNSYSSPKSLASVISVAFHLTVVAASFLMEIFLTLISTALNLSTSIFFLSYCLWQKHPVTDRKKSIAASSLFSESTQPNFRQQESYRATYSIFFFWNRSNQPLLCTQTRQLLLLEPIITHVYLLTIPNISLLICSSLSMWGVSAQAVTKTPLKCFCSSSNAIYSP